MTENCITSILSNMSQVWFYYSPWWVAEDAQTGSPHGHGAGAAPANPPGITSHRRWRGAHHVAQGNRTQLPTGWVACGFSGHFWLLFAKPTDSGENAAGLSAFADYWHRSCSFWWALCHPLLSVKQQPLCRLWLPVGSALDDQVISDCHP